MVDGVGTTTDAANIWCDYGDLRQDECHHCDPSERTPSPKTQHQIWVEQLRRDVYTAELNTTVNNVMPLHRIRTEPGAANSAPRWNPGNVAAEIGSHLTAMGDMFAALREEAETRHSDREFPGGDALVMLGPGADVEAFGYAQLSAIMGRISEQDVVLPDKRDILTPLALLASWEDVIREERDQPTYMKATIDGAIKYIRDSIDWMFSLNEYGDMQFLAVDDLAEQLGQARRRMEDILKDGSRAEFTRVKCTELTCETNPRLMKLWAAQVRWDRYRCPDCRTEYNKAQYEMAKAQAMFSSGSERFISQTEASEAAEVPLGTVSQWAARDKVRSERDEATGSLLVWWPDIRIRATERVERLRKAKIARDAKRAKKEAEERAKEGARNARLPA